MPAAHFFLCLKANHSKSRGQPAAARAAVLLHQAVVDVTARDLVDTFVPPEVSSLFDTDRPPILENTFPEAVWQAARRLVDGCTAYPAWMLA